ncbi:MAG: hypothetical protein JWL73_1736 [Actinomycetia bacterium]|nr:hypothetical protein [Actinomycetes bacterium]
MIDDRSKQGWSEAVYVPGFRCETRRDGTRATIELAGDLAIETESEVRSAFIALLDQRLSEIVFDMRGIAFLDSSGMGLLAFAERMAAMHGVALVVSGLQAEARRALETAGLAGLFVLED